MRDEDQSDRDTGAVLGHEETEQAVEADSIEPRKMEQTPMANKLKNEQVRTTRLVGNSDIHTHYVADAGGGHHRSVKN